MNKKVIILISVLVFVILTGGGFWVLKNQKESGGDKVLQNEIITQDNNQDQIESNMEQIDTSNWKTYRNEEYGFEIRYPEDLIVKDEGISTGGGVSFSKENHGLDLVINIRTKELLTFEEIRRNIAIENKERTARKLGEDMILIEEVKYNNLSCLRIKRNDRPHAMPSEIIYFTNNGKGYSFNFSADPNGNILEYKDEIINSYKLMI